MTRIELFSPYLEHLGLQPASCTGYEDTEQILGRSSGNSAGDWRPPSVRIFEEDERGNRLVPTDVLVLNKGYFVFKKDQIPVVDGILGSYGEFLQVDIGTDSRFIFIPNCHIGSLDERLSGATYFRNSPDKIKSLPSVVISNSGVMSVGVFKLERADRGPVLYRSDVKDMLEATGLFSGITFRYQGYATA